MSSARPSAARGAAWGVGALTLLAAVLRFRGLGDQSLWLDESWTHDLVQRPPVEMLRMVPRTESTPPLFYLATWVWVHVFGSSAAGLRSLSAVAGTATVPLAYLAGAALASRRVGLVVAALAATAPMLVWYSQEARAYALLVALATLSLWCMARALQTPTPGWLAAWAAAAAAALSTHYFAAFTIAPQAAWLLWSAVRATRGPLGPPPRPRTPAALWAWLRAPGARPLRLTLRALGAVGLAALVLVVVALKQVSRRNAAWITEIPLSWRVGELPRELVAGFPPGGHGWLPLIGAGLVLAALVLLLARGSRRERMAALIAGTTGIVAIVVPIGLAVVWRDFFLARNALAAWVPLGIVVAAGLGARDAGRLGIALTAALCGVGLTATAIVAGDAALQRPSWDALARQLGSARPARAIVLRGYPWARPFAVAHPGTWWMPRAGARVREVDVITMATWSGTRYCWWGAQCGLPHRLPPNGPPAPGFVLAARRAVSPYTVSHYVAASPRMLRWDELSGEPGAVGDAILLDGMWSQPGR